MLTRRTLVGFAATALTLLSGAAVAQDWKAHYPELNFAVILFGILFLGLVKSEPIY